MLNRVAPALAVVFVACLSASPLGASDVAPADDGFDISAERATAEEGPLGRIVLLEDNVTVKRGGARLVGAHGVYREWDRLAIVFGGVEGVDDGRTIACDTLKYFRDIDVAILSGNASYADSAGTTSADRIEVYREQGIAICVGRAASVARDGSSRLEASRITYDLDRQEARASGRPVLTTFDGEGEVDAVLRADVIELNADTDTVRGIGAATIVRGETTALARAVTLSRVDDSALLEGDPVVEQKRDRLRGERILIIGADGEVSRVIAVGDGRVDYHIEGDEESAGEYGHVAGDTLTMFVEGGEPAFTVARGNAESEHAFGPTGERNSVRSRTVDVSFSEGRVSRATFRGSAEGVYLFAPDEGSSQGEGGAGREQVAPEAGRRPPEGVEGAEPARADSAGLERVDYASRQIDYYVGRNRMVLRGDARVEYQNTVLTAGEVVFDPDTQVLTAEGSPDLREKSDRLVGSSLSYDLERRAGRVSDGVTTFEDGLYYGRRIEREDDGTLKIAGGVYTTCSDPRPHYRLVSHRMKIYMNDKVIARPVVLYLGEIPVLALPFYVFPIRKERHSGFLIPRVELGITEDRGRFIRNFGYYWAPSDYWDLSAWADFYEQTKWIIHAEARYKVRYVLSGSVDGSFMEELVQNKRRWDLHVRHRQEFGRHWTAGITGDFRSDASYARDAYQTIEESVNRSLHSQLWTRGSWSGLSAGITLDRREELDQDSVSELLPKVEVKASQRPLLSADESAGGLRRWLSRVSYSWSARAVNDRDRTAGESEVHQGVGLGGTIRASGKFLGALNITPRLSFSQNWYDRDKAGAHLPSRLTYSAGLSAGTTVYGTFFPGVGPLEAVRHIVEPSLSYSWTPEFSQYFDDGVDRFYSFSGFSGTPRPREAVGVSLVQKLQVKLRKGSDVRKIDNLLRFSMSSSYDFRADDLRWSDVTSRVDLRPGRATTVRWEARHDAYKWGLKRSSITVTAGIKGGQPVAAGTSWEDRTARGGSPADELRRELATRSDLNRPAARPWDASMTFRYSRGADPENSAYWVDGQLAFSPTSRWRLNYSLHYDLKEQEVASQEYAIHRDLHCWEAQFVRRYYEGEWQHYFRINVKALPEIQAESGEKYLHRTVR